MTRSGKIDPAISKKLAREIREIAKRAHNEEEVRIPVESALKPVLAQLGISAQAKVHRRLAELSEKAHALAVEETEAAKGKLQSLEAEIDETAAGLWGINATELGDIQSSLADLQ